MAHRWLAALAIAVATGSAPPAGAYEFEILARTIGQAEELRSLRFARGDLALGRRRFTQTLALHVWDIGRARREWWRLYEKEPEKGPRLSFQTYLRLDHDFGEYTGGELFLGTRSIDAIDLIPELEADSLQLDALYAYFAAEELAGGAVDLYAGRLLGLEALDWYAFDGVSARVRSPWHFAAELFGGLLVRDWSPVGSPTFEPDGTSSGECQEYVEGAAPGSGSWRPIDLGRPDDGSRFRNDFDFCPQREQLMPTFGGALSLIGVPKVNARLSYRRSISRTPDRIGPADRFEFPDTGYYPDEVGQAPGWGTNHEHISIEARAPIDLAHGRAQVTPFGAARYSLLHALVDEAHAGVRLRLGAHSLAPEAYYSFPTFDGDSIFNAFSAQPYVDGRLTYEIGPRGAAWSSYVRGWLRRFRVEDPGRAAPGADVDTGALAGGGQAGMRWLAGREGLARVDLFHEDGYGGRRTGGFALLSWRALRPLVLTTRLSLVDFAEDLQPQLDTTSFGIQAGGTYEIHEGIAASLVAEENSNAIYSSQLAVFFLLDLAFRPEL
ncbi:MAG TPA: hypothetical protein VNO33_18795 [Kofleriaceae bacterium]|nr:hypothetical protein [Kofleriaceae bacterium]